MMSIEEVLKEESRYGIDLMDVLICLSDAEVIDIPALRFSKASEQGGQSRLLNVPEPSILLSREDELSSLEKWLSDDAPFMVITGQAGMGKTALATGFIRERVKNIDVVWFSIPRDRQKEALLRTIIHFYRDVESDDVRISTIEDIRALLGERPIILVVDGYYEVEEEMVEAMAYLVRNSRIGGGTKILVTSPSGTPSYSRFFNISDIESGKVKQIMLKGLDDEGARKLLGSDIIDSNLRKIYLLTKNNPSWLVMVRDKNEEALLSKTRLTREEVRLLFFWNK